MSFLTKKILHAKIDSVCRTIAVYEQAKAMLAAKGEPLGEIQEMRLAGLYEEVKFDLRKLFKDDIKTLPQANKTFLKNPKKLSNDNSMITKVVLPL